MPKTILITGASSGIGKATARHFQEQGWNVAATMRSPQNETELGQLDRVMVTRLDVQDPASIQSAVQETIDQFGRIDVLLNNAGYGAAGPLEAAPMDEIRRQFDVNVIGLLETTKAVLPHFRANQAGKIINVSSVGGRVTFPLFSLYHGTKWAVEGISESLNYELGGLGIQVKIVEPGAIATDFGSRSLAFLNDESLTEYQTTVQNVTGAFSNFTDVASPPSLVAEVVQEAIEDDSPRMRFVAGEDAKEMLQARDEHGDLAFFAATKERFGL